MIKENLGISFPFRIGNLGGVVMSFTTLNTADKIAEALSQIVQTAPAERTMEYHFNCPADFTLFEANDQTTRDLLKYEVKTSIARLEDRIEVKSIDVKGEGAEIVVTITFSMISTGVTYSASVKLFDFKTAGD